MIAARKVLTAIIFGHIIRIIGYFKILLKTGYSSIIQLRKGSIGIGKRWNS
jgi:hypothetical protein